MSQTINSRLKKNNFDLLRLIFAATVCLVHVDELSGYQSLGWLSNVFSSAVAVKSFFVVSGFLIFMSYEHSSSLSAYFSKRVRRIYPAYATVVLISAFGLAWVSTRGIGNYFSAEWLKYLAANLVFLNFLHPDLPGVFEANTFTAVNGALWTLKVEVMFYISVPIFVLLFQKLPKSSVLAGGYILSMVYVLACRLMATKTGNNLYTELEHQLPGQLSYFLSGAFLYYYTTLLEKYTLPLLGLSAAILIANWFYPMSILEPAALAIVVIFLGLFFYVGEFGKYGDFSYGVYILHFPIIQIFLQYGWFKNTTWAYLVASLSITAVTAFLLWHGIEKRFLLRNSHYISKSTGT